MSQRRAYTRSDFNISNIHTHARECASERASSARYDEGLFYLKNLVTIVYSSMVYERRALGGWTDGHPLFLLFVYELFPGWSRRHTLIQGAAFPYGQQGDPVGLRISRPAILLNATFSSESGARVHGGPRLLLRNVSGLFMQIDFTNRYRVRGHVIPMIPQA